MRDEIDQWHVEPFITATKKKKQRKLPTIIKRGNRPAGSPKTPSSPEQLRKETKQLDEELADLNRFFRLKEALSEDIAVSRCSRRSDLIS
jgi:hypothetical protein